MRGSRDVLDANGDESVDVIAARNVALRTSLDWVKRAAISEGCRITEGSLLLPAILRSAVSSRTGRGDWIGRGGRSDWMNRFEASGDVAAEPELRKQRRSMRFSIALTVCTPSYGESGEGDFLVENRLL